MSATLRSCPLRYAGIALCLLVSGCATYEPAPVDPRVVLEALERASPRSVTSAGAAVELADGMSPLEAAAIAVHLQPQLRALRAEVGVTAAELVQAGLLPDPSIGWEAGNVIADFITDRKSTSNSYLAGGYLSWDVPRPGEIDAREGVARARVDEARAVLFAAEWRLVREVRLAWLRLAAARAALELNRAQADVARRTRALVDAARNIGEATSVQAALADVALARVEAARSGLTLEEVEGMHALLGLMGLPPSTPLVLQDAAAALDPAPPPTQSPERLTAAALARRPDLRELEARYQQAEETLRYEVARQWPEISIGTGIGIRLPIFSRFNAPAIETARRARDAARERLVSVVHELRRSVHLAHATWSQADARAATLKERLLPALEEAVRLTRAAQAAGEVSPLEILTAQAQLLEVEREVLDARVRRASALVDLEAAAGVLLPTPGGHPDDAAPPEADK